MMPDSCPASNLSEMSSRTTRSPKRLLKCCASNSAIFGLLRDLSGRDGRTAKDLRTVLLERSGDAFRLKQHHDHEQQPVPEEPGFGVSAEQVARHNEHGGP